MYGIAHLSPNPALPGSFPQVWRALADRSGRRLADLTLADVLPPRPEVVAKPKSIAVLLPNWVGDVVMVTPALRAVRQRHPRAHIVGIVRPHLADVLAGLPYLDDLLQVDKLGRSLGEMTRLTMELRSRQTDTMLLFRRSFPALALAWLSGAKKRVGYGAGIAAGLLTDNLNPPRNASGEFSWSTRELYNRIAEAAGCPVRSSEVELAPQAVDERQADAAWRQLDLPDAEQVAVLNAGSATSPSRVWPEERYAELATRIVDELGGSVLVHCGPKERAGAASIARLANRPDVRSLGECRDLPVGLSKAIMRRSRLLVTSDSGPRHLAAAFQTPTVLLAGPIDPATNYSGNLHERPVWCKPPCAPCNASHCPLLHQRCLRDSSVDRVFAAVRQAWESRREAVDTRLALQPA